MVFGSKHSQRANPLDSSRRAVCKRLLFYYFICRLGHYSKICMEYNVIEQVFGYHFSLNKCFIQSRIFYPLHLSLSLQFVHNSIYIDMLHVLQIVYMQAHDACACGCVCISHIIYRHFDSLAVVLSLCFAWNIQLFIRSDGSGSRDW